MIMIIYRAHSAFAECCSEVNQEFVDNPLDLQIEGLGHFRNSVGKTEFSRKF